MHYLRHPHSRDITLSDGRVIEAVFVNLFVGHIDSMSPVFGKSMKSMRLGMNAIGAVTSTKPGEIIAFENDVFPLVKSCFEEPEKYGAALHIHIWRHVFDWIEGIVNAPDKEPAPENVTPITKPAKAGAK